MLGFAPFEHFQFSTIYFELLLSSSARGEAGQKCKSRAGFSGCCGVCRVGTIRVHTAVGVVACLMSLAQVVRVKLGQHARYIQSRVDIVPSERLCKAKTASKTRHNGVYVNTSLPPLNEGCCNSGVSWSKITPITHFVLEGVGGVAEVQLKHDRPCLRLRERDVDSLLETTTHCRVQLPRNVRSP